MRRFIIFLLIILVSVWLGVKIAIDPGYLLVAYQHWTVEMPLWVATILFLITLFVCYVVIRIIQNTRALPAYWQHWTYGRRNRKTSYLTTDGLIALAVGNLRKAQRKFIRASKQQDWAWLNYLAAATTCHQQREYEQRDIYLNTARNITPSADTAIGIVHAQFLLQQKQYEQARISLEHLLQQAPKQTYILRTLAELYVELHDWESLLKLLPKLAKQQALTDIQINVLEIQAHSKQFAKITANTDLAALENNWQQLPRHLRNNSQLLVLYVQALLKIVSANVINPTKTTNPLPITGVTLEAVDATETLVRKALHKHWDTALVYYYGLLINSKPHQQLAHAEEWLADHGNDATLLLTLGRLSLANKLWGKARDYLQASVALQPNPETYLALANLYAQLGENNLATECYQKGLAYKTTSGLLAAQQSI